MRLASFDDDRAGVVVDDHILDLTAAAAAAEGAGPRCVFPTSARWGWPGLSSSSSACRPALRRDP